MYNQFMKIIRVERVDSTHAYLKELIRNDGFNRPVCVFTDLQTAGIGSRGNSWQGEKGNLFFSFVLKKENLPNDLPLQSSSIYFSFLLKEILNQEGSSVWLKWPNDFYINEKKIGGTITTMSNDLIYCGIGLNLINVSKEFGFLDIQINMEKTLEDYFFKLEKLISWKQIFSDFKIEFQKCKKYKATIDNQKKSLENAELNDDGSINIDNKKVFSLR